MIAGGRPGCSGAAHQFELLSKIFNKFHNSRLYYRSPALVLMPSRRTAPLFGRLKLIY